MRFNEHTKPLYDAQIGDRRGDPYGVAEISCGGFERFPSCILKTNNGYVGEWPKPPDCKSGS